MNKECYELNDVAVANIVLMREHYGLNRNADVLIKSLALLRTCMEAQKQGQRVLIDDNEVII